MKSVNNLFLLLILLAGCQTASKSENKPETTAQMKSNESYVIEITRFRIRKEVDLTVFTSRDRKIEKDYTSKQPGFLRRESAMSDDGEWLVVVYWQTMLDADASMQKFMADTTVADYAAMINLERMSMARFKSIN